MNSLTILSLFSLYLTLFTLPLSHSLSSPLSIFHTHARMHSHTNTSINYFLKVFLCDRSLVCKFIKFNETIRKQVL